MIKKQDNQKTQAEVTMKIELRKAIPADSAFLLELRGQTMGPHIAAMGLPTSKEDYLERVNYRFDDAKIIMVDNHPAGLFKTCFLADKNQWFLVQIQVHPDFQNRRIGYTLVSQLLEQAAHDHADVYLTVFKSNPAQHLYLRLGFKQVGETEHEYEMLWTPKSAL